MKLIELQKYGNCSVIVRQTNNGSLLAVEPFVVAHEVNKRNGQVVDWGHGHYFGDLFEAVNYARTATEIYHPNFHRLCEIASKAIDGLIEDDEDSAYEYFANEIEMDSDEAVYFGLDTKLLDSYK